MLSELSLLDGKKLLEGVGGNERKVSGNIIGEVK